MQPTLWLILTKSNTFSSNRSSNLTFNRSGLKTVHPESKVSPSDSTRATEVAIASALILDRRMSSLGSVDCSLMRNSSKTDDVLQPSIKSMTAWRNQSLKVALYILVRELTPSLSRPPKSRFPVLFTELFNGKISGMILTDLVKSPYRKKVCSI